MEQAQRTGQRYSFNIKDPSGRDIRIPASPAEDFAYFRADQHQDIRQYYADHGYVVVRNLIPTEQCRAAREIFSQEVRPFDGFIYRQASANAERHAFTNHGFMLNPILNVQSLDQRNFPRFRTAGLGVITHPAVQDLVHAVLGAPGKLVQSMYFEGNPVTWAHQDTYYLDAEEIGRMLAAWLAMETIGPGAGRFYIYPRSHLIDLDKNRGKMSLAFNHKRYKRHVLDIIARHGLECRAPALAEGDVLFWNAKTIHGSLDTVTPQSSRCSFTAHYIPQSSRFLQFQTRLMNLNIERIAGMDVHKPKDLASARNRAILFVETHFPRSFRLAKKVAVKLITG